MKRFRISAEWQGSRLDRFVRASLPGTPFSVTQILLRKGLIFLNGARAAGNTRLTAGDVVAVNIAEADENGMSPPPTPPRAAQTSSIGADMPVLYEDKDLLVINKPPGLVVQPGNRKERGSLLDALEDYRRRKGEPGEEPPFPYTPVHRLDRQTSGALIVAKTRPAARALSRMLSHGEVLKVYLAVVEGVPAEQRGEITIPLSTRKGVRSHSMPDLFGREADTSYAVLARVRNERALLEVTIRTGRTHQIRAHLASIGHPIAGDKEYGASSASGGRVLLHAWKLRFRHPATGAEVAVVAKPPDDLGFK
jgi:RluA family pseudouridine synthase